MQNAAPQVFYKTKSMQLAYYKQINGPPKFFFGKNANFRRNFAVLLMELGSF